MHMSVRKLFLVLSVFYSAISVSQVGVGTVMPNSSTMLDVEATNKGVLLPRVELSSSTDATTIVPQNEVGLLVFNTKATADIEVGYHFWNGTKWVAMFSEGLLSGAGNPNTNGTTGGAGGTDLYVSEISTNSYTTPENLRELNTIGNEMFPFVGEDDTLYFSSNGHSNLGGLDVFHTKISSDGTFETPQNIGKPINSAFDDFAFVVDEQTGYFASNRENQNDDIYGFINLEELEEETPRDVVFEGVVLDKKTGDPIPNAEVEFINGLLEEVGRVETDAYGRYAFDDKKCGNVTIIRADEANYFANETVVSGVDGGIVQTNIELNKPDPIREAIESGTVKDLAVFINPIYFDYGKSFIRPDASVELDKIVAILEDYPAMEIDVRSHTDSRSSDSFNMNLSDRRAKSTIEYLVQKGISRSRLTGRGYGESQLVNRCSNGVQCSAEEHQQNRRSEFIITKQ